MPRRLILMRHAKQSGLAVRDHDRPLTDEGLDDAYRVGLRLADLEFNPERVLSSTALRCQQTWEAVSTGLGPAAPPPTCVDFEATLYNAASQDLLEALADIDDEVETLLLLAHNPGMSMLGLELGGNDPSDLEELRRGFTPATIACFEIDGRWSTVSARTARLLRFELPARG
jgi:phosphohistidine phosphatase